MNPYEVAIDLLERKGWTQHQMRSISGKLCLMGALSVATAGGISHQLTGDGRRCCYFFSEVTGIESIPHWNDRDGRTVDEVIEELRIVAKAYTNKGGF